ncbi:MAG: hypothetical protein ACR2HJ_04865 [Fimbriimonadales bacterium]
MLMVSIASPARGETSVKMGLVHRLIGGHELWMRRYNGQGNYLENAIALAVDAEGTLT